MPLPERVALGEKATAAIGLDGTYRAVPIPTQRGPAKMAAAE
jgi:hypothetical protein